LDFGTKTFSFQLGEYDKEEENTNFVMSLAHCDMRLPFIDKLIFGVKFKLRCNINYRAAYNYLLQRQQSFPSAPSASTIFLFSSSLRRMSSCFYM